MSALVLALVGGEGLLGLVNFLPEGPLVFALDGLEGPASGIVAFEAR
jgi:hypothetical protein